MNFAIAPLFPTPVVTMDVPDAAALNAELRAVITARQKTHPGSFWSGVYYVDDGGAGVDASLGGELEFMDPRGPGPAMYAPQLAFAMAHGLSVGANETVPPKAGRLVMFPAWVLHQVRPYRGGAERISIAFN